MITAAMVAGGVGGLGVFWLAWQTLARTPAARPALRRLYPQGVGVRLPQSGAEQWSTGMVTRWWRPPRRQLALLGRTPRQYAITLAASALVGLGSVTVLAALLAVAGVTLPVVVPAGTGVVVAAVAAWGAHHEVLAKAANARYEFRHAVCSYLDMVSLELAAGHGPVAALERAASGVDGWVFARIHQSLLRAQLQLQQPWEELRRLAADIDVPELGDVGEIVAAAGADGAVVHDTLLSRAASLRDQIRVETLARARRVTTQMEIPAAVLLLLLALFAIYPLMARFLTS